MIDNAEHPGSGQTRLSSEEQLRICGARSGSVLFAPLQTNRTKARSVKPYQNQRA